MANYYDWDGETRSSHHKKVKKTGRLKNYKTSKLTSSEWSNKYGCYVKYGRTFRTKKGYRGAYVYTTKGKRIGFVRRY